MAQAQAILPHADAKPEAKSSVKQALSQFGDGSNRRALRFFSVTHCLLEGRKAGYREVRSYLQERAKRLGREAEKIPKDASQDGGSGKSRAMHAAAAECFSYSASLQHRKTAASVNHRDAASHFRAALMHASAGKQELLAGQKLEESNLPELDGPAMARYQQALEDFRAARNLDGVRRASAALARVEQKIELASADRHLAEAKALVSRADSIISAIQLVIDSNSDAPSAIDMPNLKTVADCYTQAAEKYRAASEIYTKYGKSAEEETATHVAIRCFLLARMAENLQEAAGTPRAARANV